MADFSQLFYLIDKKHSPLTEIAHPSAFHYTSYRCCSVVNCCGGSGARGNQHSSRRITSCAVNGTAVHHAAANIAHV